MPRFPTVCPGFWKRGVFGGIAGKVAPASFIGSLDGKSGKIVKLRPETALKMALLILQLRICLE